MTTPKTTEVVQTTADNLDMFMGKINTAIDIVSQKLVEVAPEAARLLLGAVQVTSILQILAAVLLTISGLLIFAFGVSSLKAVKTKEKISDRSEYVGEPTDARQWMRLWISLFGVITGACIFLSNFGDIFIVNNWLGAIIPEGYVGIKALEAAGVKLW